MALTGCDTAREFSPYPPFFSYVTGEIDLTGTLPESIRDVTIDSTTYPGTTDRVFSILVHPDTVAADVLILLDQSFSVLLIESSQGVIEFDTDLFVNHLGGIQIGNLSYDIVDGVVSNLIRQEDLYDPILYHPSDYVQFGADSGIDLVLRRWSIAWAPSGAGDTQTQAFADGRIVRQATAMFRYNGGAEPSLLSVFIQDETDVTYRRVIEWETFDLGTPGFSAWIDPTAADVVAYPKLSFDSLQDTPAGLLFIDRDEGELVRIDGASGAELDRFDPGKNPRTDQMYPVVFDPAGEFYLLLDTELRVLYRVAPWW